MAKTPDPLLVAQRAQHRLAQRDTDVFHCVVPVDVQVALRMDVEVEQAVARDLVQHVVEETDTSVQPRLPGSVEVDAYGDLRLGRVARDFRVARRPRGYWID